MDRTIARSGRDGRTQRGVPSLIVVAVLTLAFVGLPVVASAGPPAGESSSGVDIGCESEAGFFGLHVDQSEEFGFLDVFFESFEEPAVLFGFTEEFSFDGTSLSAEVEMYAEFFEDGEEPVSVGFAAIDAAFDPVGEPEVFMDRFRDGNRWVEVREMFQMTEVSGTVFLDGYLDFDLSDCNGNFFEFDFWSTNPTAYNNRFEGRFLECALESPDSGFGHLFADSGDFGSFMDVFVASADGPALVGFGEDYTFTDTQLSAMVTMFDEETGEPTAEAIVEAALESSGSSTSTLIWQDGWSKVVMELFDVTGIVTVDGSEFEMVDCYAEAFAQRVHFSSPSGPKPTGATPDNDTPDGALSLEARGTVNAQTKAAVNAPEAECTFTIDEFENGENGENGEEPGEEFPLPIGKTLWYSFIGTGESVTIDSHGSNFDTVMGIYDDELNQITCVDDVGDESGFTLQAAATIDTEAGHTYLVQIGGLSFFQDPDFESVAGFGRVRLDMS